VSTPPLSYLWHSPQIGILVGSTSTREYSTTFLPVALSPDRDTGGEYIYPWVLHHFPTCGTLPRHGYWWGVHLPASTPPISYLWHSPQTGILVGSTSTREYSTTFLPVTLSPDGDTGGKYIYPWILHDSALGNVGLGEVATLVLRWEVAAAGT
jgi:hypothetical protein